MRPKTTIEHDGTTYHAELGTIESASLGIEDHGFLSSWIHLSFPGSGQGFGGMVLGRADDRAASFLTEKWVRGILRVAGTTDWQKLTGAKVYALRESEWGTIVGLVSLNGDHVFMSESISRDASGQARAFTAQHHLARLTNDLERLHKEAFSLERSLNILRRNVAEAVADIAETESEAQV